MPIDYHALRVALEQKIRPLRGPGQTDAVSLAEQAVDVGTQELILRAAEAFGLLGGSESPPEMLTSEPPSEPPAD